MHNAVNHAMFLAQCIEYTAATLQPCYILHVAVRSRQLSQLLQPQ